MKTRKILSVFIMISFFASPVYALMVHEEITGPFENPMQVTTVCIGCHEDAAPDIMKTQHWNWAQKQKINGQEQLYGKRNSMTNFGIRVCGNLPICTSCHIGYGWKDKTFDFSDATRVDCLVCHDTTGTYKKDPLGAGMPVGFHSGGASDEELVDLEFVARNVGQPSKRNCGACHFGDYDAAHVKHGNLNPSFAGPSRNVDIHMAADGNNFDCQECHYPEEKHNIKGHYTVPSLEGTYQSGCIECHSDAPHKLAVLNSHYEAIACQTCHIPFYSMEYPTKVEWDWSAVKREKKNIKESITNPTMVVRGIGGVTWGTKLVPVYEWYNGSEKAYMAGDKIDAKGVTELYRPEGDLSDHHSKIFPFKVQMGKQIYDQKHNILIPPHITEEAATAFWSSYDWDKSARIGAKAAGLPYSGEYGFAETIMYWRLNHGVVSSDKALDCLKCHGSFGRMDWEHLGYNGDPWMFKGLYRCSPEFQAGEEIPVNSGEPAITEDKED